MIGVKWRISSARRPAGVKEVLAELLRNRNVDEAFLNAGLKDLEPHLDMQDMRAGAELTARHIREQNPIVLVGDYDCDGVTSAAQAALFLRRIGYTNFETVFSTRSEGYGIPERAVAGRRGPWLLITMDCGSLEIGPITRARESGGDVVVIDHHEVPGRDLAPATALINPKHPDCSSTFKEFCASGLTLLFLAALRKALNGHITPPNLGGPFIALAAMGTVADMVPLVGPNRIITRSGLESINREDCPPIGRLMDVAGLSNRTVTAGHLGYYVGPRINVASRLDEARPAFELLTSEDPAEMDRLAKYLNRLNEQRRQQEDAILNELKSRPPAPGRRSYIVGNPRWPHGIVGILASRIQQEIRFGPAIVFSVDEKTGMARGSARSVPGFDIVQALAKCDDLMIKWGGHKMAAGMTLPAERLPEFSERFEAIAQESPPETFLPTSKADMELDLRLVSKELVDALRQLEPHGLGNPAPVFAVRGVRIKNPKEFGKDRTHLRVGLSNNLDGIFWRGAQRFRSLTDGSDAMDVAFQVDWDQYAQKPLLTVKDLGRLF